MTEGVRRVTWETVEIRFEGRPLAEALEETAAIIKRNDKIPPGQAQAQISFYPPKFFGFGDPEKDSKSSFTCSISYPKEERDI